MDKIKIEVVQDGLLVNRKWLNSHGILNTLVDYYVRKKYLERIAHGIYRRPGGELKWQHVVYSLQVLGFNVYVGARSAIDLQGLGHYLPLSDRPCVQLLCGSPLPPWVSKIKVNAEFKCVSNKLFQPGKEMLGVKTVPFGSWDWQINMSLPERGFLEMVSMVPHKESFHMADVVMEGAVNFRPAIVNDLLKACRNIKAKRLFLWFAEKHQHSWFDKITTSAVDLGKGKRVIVQDGKLDTKYLITVPRENNGQEQSIF